ncbi:MAG: hypothetical protein CM15mP18_2740 [Methanobacteriota archaeon]|nr:MAG: hypothetical protein CM15mP18_2740 [Euryarchaeota archaeon]
MGVLLAFLMIWAAFGTGRRVRVHLLPTYQAAYAEKPMDLKRVSNPVKCSPPAHTVWRCSPSDQRRSPVRPLSAL